MQSIDFDRQGALSGHQDEHEHHDEQAPQIGKTTLSEASEASSEVAGGESTTAVAPGQGSVGSVSPSRHAGIVRRGDDAGSAQVAGQAHVCGQGCAEHSRSDAAARADQGTVRGSANSGRVAGSGHICGASCAIHGGRMAGGSKHQFPHKSVGPGEKDEHDGGQPEGSEAAAKRKEAAKAGKGAKDSQDAAKSEPANTASPTDDKKSAAPGQGQLAGAARVGGSQAVPAALQQVGGRGSGSLAGMGFVGGVAAALPAGFPEVKGLTSWDGQPKGPELRITSTETVAKNGKSTWTAKIERTTSKDQSITAVAAPAGEYDLQKKAPVQNGEGEDAQYDEWLKVSGADHSMIVRGEQEHVDDCKLAYTLTLKAVENAINAVAGQSFKGPDQATAEKKARDAVEKRLPAKLKQIEGTMGVMAQLIETARAARDDTGYHTLDTTFDSQDDKGQKLWSKLKKGGSAAIGSKPSASIVKL